MSKKIHSSSPFHFIVGQQMLHLRDSCEEQKGQFTSFSGSPHSEAVSLTATKVGEFSVVTGLVTSFSVVPGLITSLSVMLGLITSFSVVSVLLTTSSVVPCLVTSSGRRHTKLFVAICGLWIRIELSADSWWSCPFDEFGTEFELDTRFGAKLEFSTGFGFGSKFRFGTKFGLGNGFGFAIFEVLESTGVVWDGNGLTIAFLEFLSFLDGVQCTIG